MNDDKPIYKHDCSECEYLRTFTPSDNTFQPIAQYDLYAHARERMIELIARYGDSPPDYLSGCCFLGYPEDENPCLEIPIFKEIFNRYNEKFSLKK